MNTIHNINADLKPIPPWVDLSRLQTQDLRKHRSKTVPRLSYSADSISRGLQNSWPYRPTALLVTINSAGGSLVQAKSISDLLKLYSNRYKYLLLLLSVPIVTFVEDQCLGSANLLLTAGVKCYASIPSPTIDNFSLIGDVGVAWSKLWYHKFAEKYDIKQEYIFAGENKVKFNQFEEIKP